MKILETIELRLINLTRQKPKPASKAILELRENSIRYFIQCYALETDVEDEEVMKSDDVWKEVFNYVDITALRANISGMEMAYCQDSEVWRTTLFISGFYNDIRIYFKNKAECQELTDKLSYYIYG